MNSHRSQPKFDELEVGQILKQGERLLQIVEIDYRRNIVYYQEVDTQNQGTLTESCYSQARQNGTMHVILKSSHSF